MSRSLGFDHDYAELARQHLEFGYAALNCGDASIRRRLSWVRIAATAAAVSAVDAYLERNSTFWAGLKSAGRNKKVRGEQFVSHYNHNVKVTKAFQKLYKLGYDDRYDHKHTCSELEARTALNDALLVLDSVAPAMSPLKPADNS